MVKGVALVEFGSMNNPKIDLVKELQRISKEGFDFVDLTIESPGARPMGPKGVDVRKIKKALNDLGLGAVGSTDWHLQIGSPWKGVRHAAREEIIRVLPMFSELGAEFVTVHYDFRSAPFESGHRLAWNVESFKKIAEVAEEHRIKIMVEHASGESQHVREIKKLVDALPISFHLDVGHANIGDKTNASEKLLGLMGNKLAHVHVSDNHGGDNVFACDEHLGLGLGSIDWRKVVKDLKRMGYDGTITLETFHPKGALKKSLVYLKGLWGGA